MAQNWTTRDYYDPFPGLQAGMQMAAQREGMRSNRAAEGRAAASDARAAEDQKMRQADMLARMGVDPVMSPEGGIDWQATGVIAQKKAQLTKEAEGLGTMHAWTGVQGPLTEGEAALSQTPEYQRAFRMASTQKAIADAQRAAQMEQIGARGEAALEVARQRGENASKPQATITRKLGDGSTVRIPVDPSEAMQMGEKPAPETDKWDQAIDTITRFRDAGEPIDIELDAEGFPKISKSRLWHSASPGNKGSYDAAIDQIRKRAGKSGAPQGTGGKPRIRIE